MRDTLHLLRTHLKINFGEKLNNASFQASFMRKHFKTHSVEQSYKYEQCDFAWRTHLKIHSGEKSNKCDRGDFSSVRASNLRKYLKTHIGEKS